MPLVQVPSGSDFPGGYCKQPLAAALLDPLDGDETPWSRVGCNARNRYAGRLGMPRTTASPAGNGASRQTSFEEQRRPYERRVFGVRSGSVLAGSRFAADRIQW